MLSLLLLVGAALCGALAAARLGVPLGALMGSLTATVLLQATGLVAFEPAPIWALTTLYAAVGLMVGLRVTRSSLRQLRGAALPAIIVPAVMIVSGIALGLLYAGLASASGLQLDLVTAVLAVTPGGFQEIAIAAEQLDAVLAIVVVSHVIRILTVLYTYPKIVDALVRSMGAPHTAFQPEVRTGSSAQEVSKGPAGALRWTAIALCAALGGAAGFWSGIPAGTVVFAILGAASAKIAVGADSASLPHFLRLALQVGLGITIGLQFALGPLVQAGYLLLPLVVSLGLLLAIAVVTGLVIYRFTRTDLATSLWMSAPGGLMEVAVMADAMDVDTLPVLAVHTLRVLLIIAIQPSLVLLLSGVL